MYYKLKEIRKSCNYTSDYMAKELKISKAFYSQIENGKRRLLYETAIRIASVFNVKPDYLFYNDTLDSINEKR